MDTLNLFFIVIFLCQMLWYLYFVGGDSLKHPQSWNKTLARKKILPPLRRYHWLCFDHSPNLLDNQKKFKAVNFCKRAFFWYLISICCFNTYSQDQEFLFLHTITRLNFLCKSMGLYSIQKTNFHVKYYLVHWKALIYLVFLGIRYQLCGELLLRRVNVACRAPNWYHNGYITRSSLHNYWEMANLLALK